MSSKVKPDTSGVLIKIVKYLILAVVLYFVYQAFASNWDEVSNFDWQINFWLLLLSIIAHLVTFALFSEVWCILMRGFGFTIKLHHSFKISYIANLGRYLPGRIWPVFGMAYLAKQLGIKEQESVTSWIIVQIFAIPSAFIVGTGALLLSPDNISMNLSSFMGIGFYIFTLAVFILSLLIIFTPELMFKLFNHFLIKIKREPINFQIKISTAIRIFVGYMICWIFYGFSFWLFIVSISGNFDLPLTGAIGTFALAYQIGYLSIFAPGGIGVREYIIKLLLTPFIGPVAVGVAIAARLWNMLTEILAALIALMIKLPKNNSVD